MMVRSNLKMRKFEKGTMGGPDSHSQKFSLSIQPIPFFIAATRLAYYRDASRNAWSYRATPECVASVALVCVAWHPADNAKLTRRLVDIFICFRVSCDWCSVIAFCNIRRPRRCKRTVFARSEWKSENRPFLWPRANYK